jgi:hypothetical protein
MIMYQNSVPHGQAGGPAETSKADWYKLYAYLPKFIEEYEKLVQTKAGNAINDQGLGVFLDFVSDFVDTLDPAYLDKSQQAKLFKVTVDLLEQTTAGSQPPSPQMLKVLYSAFNILMRVDAGRPSVPQATTLFNLIANWSDYVDRQFIHNRRGIDTIEPAQLEAMKHFTWVSNALLYDMGMKYRGLSAIDAGAVENCARQVASLSTKVHDVLLRSNEKDGWLFRTNLGALRSVRQIDTTNNDNTKRVLDDLALQLSQATEGRLSSDPALINTFREMTYIQYASKLGADIGRLQGHYSKVEKKDVFPSHFTFTFGGTDERTGTTYNIHYRSPLSAEEMARLKQELKDTHSRFERVHGGISDHLAGKKFDLYIFDSQQEYETYGSLWGVNTAAGGYAHTRRFRDDDVYTRYDLSPEYAASHFIQTEAFVAKRPGLDLPRNFGHEAVHLMTYGLVGQAGMQHLPSWFVEGMANSLGNPHCLEEEIGYIARYQGQGRAFPTVAKILTMNYGNGADLYYFGSRLFSYCLEKKPEFTWNLLEAAKKGDKAAVADLLKQLEETPRVSEEFHQWLSELVTTCKTAPPSAGRATTLAAGAVATVSIPSLLTAASRTAIAQGSQFTRKMLTGTSSPTKVPATDNNMILWIVLAVGIAIGTAAAVLACKFCRKQRRLPSGNNNPGSEQEAGKSGVAKPLLKPVDDTGVEMMVRSMEQQQTPFLQQSATAGPQNKVGSTCAIS